MKVAAVLLLALATAHAKLPPAPRFAAKQTLKTTAVTSSPATLAALQVRGGGMVPGDAYVKFFVATSIDLGALVAFAELEGVQGVRAVRVQPSK